MAWVFGFKAFSSLVFAAELGKSLVYEYGVIFSRLLAVGGKIFLRTITNWGFPSF
jgi:hypothetical protein